jgi:transposase
MAPTTLNQKIEIIELSAMGLKPVEIAKQLKKDPKTVRLWMKRWREERSVDAKSRSGRPEKISDENKAKILSAVQCERNVTASKLKRDCAIQVTERTITNFLNKNGYKSYIAPKRPFHMPNHLIARSKFSEEVSNWSFEEWKNVIFTDEKTFINHQVTKKRVWKQKGEEIPIVYCQAKASKPISINVWGAITPTGFIWIRNVGKNFKSIDYLEIIKEIWPE